MRKLWGRHLACGGLVGRLLGLLASLAVFILSAAEYHGQVTFNGLPVPGATVTASQAGQTITAITDLQGAFSIPSLTEGTCTIEIRMLGFAPVRQEVNFAPNTPPATWGLKILPLDQIKAEMQTPVQPAPSPTPAPAKPASDDDLSQQAADGFLINGSSQNGAASPFAQLAAFGNNRNGARGLYNGGIGVILDNSALDARPYSLTGQNAPKLTYNRLTGVAVLGGPLQIPHVFKRPPYFFAAYQWTRNNTASDLPGLMPTQTERNGIFASPIVDPATGVPYPNNTVPQNRISPQAQALLSYYPLPNFTGNTGYNYQIPILSPTHQDALQSRFNKTLGPKDELYGRFAFQSMREGAPNLFGFLDTTDLLGINTSVNWSHRINHSWFLNLGYQFSRLATHITPFFEDRENVSGEAGISGNDQEPMNWGPPSLTFSSGIAGLSDAQSSFDRNETSGLSGAMRWYRGGHNVTFGSDFRREEFNYLAQQNPRGSFTFTSAVSGSDFADFLLGVPDTSAIAFGNADKYFRESVYDAFVNDDWRVNPELTVNAGLRWEYGAPITELYDRLVNLDISPGFAAVAPVVATDPSGSLTGTRYPNSLVYPDKRGIEPRVGLAWRPISGSSTVIRAGYGIYYDTSVYQTIAVQMAQQPPLSKTLSVENSPSDPLTLANGFNASPAITPNTFAIDPRFRPGYAQNWQASLQRDLPASMQLTATYIGIKGTDGPQEFLPNTHPIGAVNPCPACPTGFAYLTSYGNSTRQAAQIQFRRRLHNGFTGILQYTYSKSIDDDAALGGQGASATGQNSPSAASSGSPSSQTGPASLAIAQNWRDLAAERGLSTFDQRHLLSLQMQYSTGMGIGGGTLLTGWKGALFKEWNLSTEIIAGSGLPETPIYLATVPGTGVTNTIRPDYTGAPLNAAPSGLFLNPAAFIAPPPGQWGNAGRDTITGPAQFSLNASLGRTFRVSDRLNLDLRVDSTNLLNHVTYTSWNTIVNSSQFGLAAQANAMRSMQTTLRLRF
ncbi:MAG: carboxypeptidase regulatory-like domain-containing protein [Bryobacteraceae bacterium]